MNKLIKMAAAAAMLAGMLAFAPTAQATDGVHQDRPTPVVAGVPKAECVVGAGSTVAIAPGLSATPSHNTYQFVSTTIICAGDPNYIGTYDVTASGGTDGHIDPLQAAGHAHDAHHGEDCESGWSRGPGIIKVKRQSDGKSAIGSVEFVRGGSVVEAWGTLDWDGEKKTDKFHAELQFTPTTGDCAVTPVTTAALNGVATIFN